MLGSTDRRSRSRTCRRSPSWSASTSARWAIRRACASWRCCTSTTSCRWAGSSRGSGQSQPKVSNHLACLRWCGFVQTRRDHPTVYYRIADERVSRAAGARARPAGRQRRARRRVPADRLRRLLMQARRYDLAIVGSGGGAFAAAIAARRRDLRVVMVERGTVGGTCVNDGCIPSKALLAAAEARHRASDAPVSGHHHAGRTRRLRGADRRQARDRRDDAPGRSTSTSRPSTASSC